MGRTACTQPQCLYKGALYLYIYIYFYGIKFAVARGKRYGSITTHISVTRGIIDAFIICYKTKPDRMVTERGVTFSMLNP